MMPYSRTASSTSNTEATAAEQPWVSRMELDKACATRKHSIFGKIPPRPLPFAGDSSDCNFFSDSEFLQSRGQQHSGMCTEGRLSHRQRDKPGSWDPASLRCELRQEHKGKVTCSGDLRSSAKPGRLRHKAERSVRFYSIRRWARRTPGSEQTARPRGASIAPSSIKTTQVLYNLYAFLNASRWEIYLLK